LKLMRSLFFALAFFLLSCRPSPVNIMLIMPDETRMDDFKKGLELAIESINSEGGIYGHNVKVLAAGKPDGFTGGSFKDLKTGTVSVIIIATSDKEKLASVEKTAGDVPVIVINPISAPAGSRLVSFSKNGDDEAAFFGEFCAFSLHASKVLIIDENPDLTKPFRGAFEKDGRESVRVELSNPVADNEIQMIRELLNSDIPPQAVFWASGSGVPDKVSKMLNEELDGRVLFIPFSSVLDEKAETPQMTVTAVPYFEARKNSLSSQEFDINYRNEFKSAPSSHSALGYDLMMGLKQSFESGAKTAGEVRDFFSGKETVFTLLGKLTFSRNCELSLPLDAAAADGDSIVPLRELDRNALIGLQEKVLSFRYGNKNGKNTKIK
jgi:ABC-type branched-subunit amino acid transport system substrate-binding protein